MGMKYLQLYDIMKFIKAGSTLNLFFIKMFILYKDRNIKNWGSGSVKNIIQRMILDNVEFGHFKKRIFLKQKLCKCLDSNS